MKHYMLKNIFFNLIDILSIVDNLYIYLHVNKIHQKNVKLNI